MAEPLDIPALLDLALEAAREASHLVERGWRKRPAPSSLPGLVLHHRPRPTVRIGFW